MADRVWENVRGCLGEHSLALGPYFAYQALHTPRHLLYTLARYKFAARMLPQRGAWPFWRWGVERVLGPSFWQREVTA